VRHASSIDPEGTRSSEPGGLLLTGPIQAHEGGSGIGTRGSPGALKRVSLPGYGCLGNSFIRASATVYAASLFRRGPPVKSTSLTRKGWER
jgi:hypothetical protein